MQIPRLNLIIYNYHNQADLSTLISTDEMIFSKALTCSRVVRLSSCRYSIFYSFGDMYGLRLGSYDCTDIGSPKVSNEGTTCGKLMSLFLGDWIGPLCGLEIGKSFGNKIWFSDAKVLGKTHFDLSMKYQLVHMMIQCEDI